MSQKQPFMLGALALLALLFNPATCIFNKVKPSACFEEMEEGSCQAGCECKFTPSYYYDSGEAVCRPFLYRGCGGNNNRFENLADCQRKCRNVCSLPKKVGPCEAAKTAYFFNKDAGKCQPFTFGGCEPNANNFDSIEECRRSCPDANDICLEKEFAGNAQNPNYDIRWVFSTWSWSCKPFVYSGENGNNNNFRTDDQCKQSCPLEDLCRFPADRGPCQSNVTKWHYDEVSGQCRTFRYGGCLGNDNNFDSKVECELQCPKTQVLNTCSLPKAGEAMMTRTNEAETQDRFYYDVGAGACKFFAYSGTGGNANNFRSVEECNLNCPEKSPCAESLDEGTQSGQSVIRWWYNIASGRCQAFVYRGMGGNRNRFPTRTMCQNTCIGCAEKSARGPCLGFQLRYAYNRTTNKCDEFVYGGCRGNRNRFESPEECYRRCQ